MKEDTCRDTQRGKPEHSSVIFSSDLFVFVVSDIMRDDREDYCVWYYFEYMESGEINMFLDLSCALWHKDADRSRLYSFFVTRLAGSVYPGRVAGEARLYFLL